MLLLVSNTPSVVNDDDGALSMQDGIWVIGNNIASLDCVRTEIGTSAIHDHYWRHHLPGIISNVVLKGIEPAIIFDDLSGVLVVSVLNMTT